MLYLVLVSTAGSLVLSAYVLAVGNHILRSREADTLGRIVLNAVNELSAITVESRPFGYVGVLDKYGEAYSDAAFRERAFKGIQSINTIYSNLRFIALVADKLNYPMIYSLVKTDFEEAHKVEAALAEKINLAMQAGNVDESEANQGFFNFSSFMGLPENIENRNGNYIYRGMMRALHRAARDGHLAIEHVDIKLGFLRSRGADGAPPAPPFSDAMTADQHSGLYQTGVPVSVPNLGPIMFTPTASATKLVKSDEFVADDRISAPTAILLEVQFRTKARDPKQPDKVILKKACAVIGGPLIDPTPSALVLNFPQGMPNVFNSVRALLFAPIWKNTGRWQRATGGEIPGSGKLTACEQPGFSKMTPADALAVATYHWLRTLPGNTDPRNCLRLLNSNWTIESVTDNTAKPQNGSGPFINSCLAQSNNTRISETLAQTGPGGIGQKAISDLFEGTDSNSGVVFDQAPSSALPLTVDRLGACNLPDRKGFDIAFVKNFFNAVYETNLAAIETLTVARSLHEKSFSTRLQLRSKLAMEKQEHASLRNRLDSLVEKSAVVSPEANRLERLQTKIDNLQESISENEKTVAKVEKLGELTAIAASNAGRAADFTYALCANAFSLCRDGLYLLRGSPDKYLIGQKYVFVPEHKPISEFDFDDAATALLKNPAALLSSPWLYRDMTFRLEVDELLASHDAAFSNLKTSVQNIIAQTPAQELHPTIVVYDSQSMAARGNARPKLFVGFPSFNVGIPKGQMFYYCPNALTTGANPDISWSVVIRDLAASRLEGNLAQPIRSQDEGWCKQQGQAIGVSPGLSCEFQLRTPLPVLKDFPVGSVVRNRAGQSAIQIPPLPLQVL
jgi:hypothetical protein